MSNKVKEVEEITIPVPWGQISGKWWGPKNVRPILCLHGIEDNAGSFDTLIPLLPNRLSYLALDLPGHGKSSYLPDGQTYTTFGYMHTFVIILDIFKWDTVSLLCHSMSVMICFTYIPCCFRKIDLFIALDSLKPHIFTPDQVITLWTSSLEKGLIADKRNQSQTEPPCFTYDELLDKFVAATHPSVTRDVAKYIVNRGIKSSTLFPGKFYFSRDNRVKSTFYTNLPQNMAIEFAKRITIPFCFLVSSYKLRLAQEVYWNEVIDVLLKTNSNFETHTIDGDHFVHLSEPQKIAGILCKFIDKHRPMKDVDVDISKL